MEGNKPTGTRPFAGTYEKGKAVGTERKRGRSWKKIVDEKTYVWGEKARGGSSNLAVGTLMKNRSQEGEATYNRERVGKVVRIARQ